MPSRCSAFGASTLDLHAELGELLGARGELGRPEHVGRLVDEIAGERHAIGDGARAAQELASPLADRRSG